MAPKSFVPLVSPISSNIFDAVCSPLSIPGVSTQVLLLPLYQIWYLADPCGSFALFWYLFGLHVTHHAVSSDALIFCANSCLSFISMKNFQLKVVKRFQLVKAFPS